MTVKQPLKYKIYCDPEDLPFAFQVLHWAWMNMDQEDALFTSEDLVAYVRQTSEGYTVRVFPNLPQNKETTDDCVRH